MLMLFPKSLIAQEFTFHPQRYVQPHNSTNPLKIPFTSGATYDDNFGETKHDKWEYMQATSTWNTEFKFKSVVNIIRAGVDWDVKTVANNYKYRIDLQLVGKTTPGTSTVTKNISLIVEYNKDSLQVHNDHSVFKLDAGFHSFTTKLTGVYDVSGSTPTIVLREALIRNFYIETEILTQRYDLFVDKPLLVQAEDPYIVGGSDLKLNWGFYGTGGPTLPSPCGTLAALISPKTPIMYELEWQYIDDYKVNIGTDAVTNTYTNSMSGTVPNLSYDFRNNATRVRTWETRYKIPAIYEHGVVVFRVRYIRTDPDNYEKLKYSAWSIPDVGTIAFNSTMCFRNSAAILYQPHQNDSLNWQYSINFAEDGKYKHVLNYFDGSGNNRQTQTKINTDVNYVVVADKIYDFEGRPAIQTLPIPVQSTTLNYKSDLSINTGTNVPYKAADFDFGCVADSIVPFKSTALASKYYSPLNPDQTGMQKFVPDAEGYPFVETIYAPDNTNKVIWQGGAGRSFQRWKGHGTRYAYVRAQQTELNRLMGAEAGRFEYYPKQIVTDANGQSSSSIFNPSGKVVATALLGTPPASANYPISALPGLPTPTATVPVDLLAYMTQSIGGGKRIAEHTFFAEGAGLNKLRYGVSINPYNPGCASEYLNLQAQYSIKVVDDCGNVGLQQNGTAGTTGITTVSTPQRFSGAEFTGTLPVDKYTIVKELYFPDTAIVRISGEFTDRNTGINKCYVYQDSVIRRTVDSAKFPCIAGDTVTSCDQRKAQMIKEMYPGEKYAKYIKNAAGGFAAAGDNSIFNLVGENGEVPSSSSSDLCTYYVYCGLVYVGDPPPTDPGDPTVLTHYPGGGGFVVNGSVDTIYAPFTEDLSSLGYDSDDCAVDGPYDCDGPVEFKHRYQWGCLNLPSVSVPVGTVVIGGVTTYLYSTVDAGGLTPDQLIYYFNDAIAEALLPLHPEYCKLLMCEDGNFDKKITYARNYKDAEALGMHTLAGILAQDPLNNAVDADAPLTPAQLSFFEMDGLLTGTGAGDLLRRIDTFSLEQAYCGCNSPEAYLYCKNFQYKSRINTMNLLNDEIKDLYFEKLRNNYLSNRNYLKQRAMDAAASCEPCPEIRLVQLDSGTVFPVLFEPSGDDVSADAGLPSWASDIIEGGLAGSSFGGTIPTAITDSIAKYKERQRNTQIDHIMQNLLNCTGVTVGSTKYNNIKAALVTSGGTGDGSNLSPAQVKTALAAQSVALSDLCNPYLAEYGLFDKTKTQDKGAYVPLNDAFYTDFNDFLALPAVETALSNATAAGGPVSSAVAIPANTTDLFERSLCTALSIPVATGGSFTVKGYKTTVTEAGGASSDIKYYKLLLQNGANADTIFLANRKVVAADYACSNMLSPTGVSNANLFLFNRGSIFSDPYVSSITPGYIAGNVVFAEIAFPGILNCGQFVIWSHKINMLKKKDPEGLDNCLNCLSMKSAVESYNADTLGFKMAQFTNHPLFDKTFSNYLNNKLKKQHTFEEYQRLMQGCALSDKIAFRKSRGNYEVTIASGAGIAAAESLINNIKTTFPDVYLSSFYFQRTAGDVVIWFDFNTVKDAQLLTIRNHIADYTPAPSSRVWGGFNATYVGELFVKSGCTAPVISGATLTTETVNLRDFGGTLQPYVRYRVDATDDSPLGVANATKAMQDYMNTSAAGCSKPYALYSYELYRSDDYASTLKQNYLTYAYGLTGTADVVNDKLGPAILKTAVPSFSDAAMKLSYIDPWCTNTKEDLHYYFDNVTSAGFTKLTTVLNQVKSALGSNKLFPTATTTSIAVGTLGGGGTSLKAIKMADGGVWYRLFDQQNKRFNVYLYPATNMVGDPNLYTMVAGTTAVPNPVRISQGDSMYRFKVNMVKSGHTVTCYGYADFSLGAGGKLQNVVLFDHKGKYDCLDTLPCERQVYNGAVVQGIMLHGAYIDSIKNSHYLAMRNYFPANAVDTLKFSTQQQQYHYTLYYYDQAGNLTRTVPPAGVTPMSILTETANNAVDAARNSGSLTTQTPIHGKVSTYRYNTYNQLTSQETPDGGKTEFFYDGAGRLVFSQNAQQRLDNKCSYTLYDDQSRISETGQFIYEGATLPTVVTNSQNTSMTMMATEVTGKVREDVVATFYDEALLALVDEPGMSAQQNLRKRVSSILYCNKLAEGTGAPNYYSYASHFSYDALGNVSTLIQDNPYLDYMKQRFKRIDYDYDLLSGKVNMVSYNRGFADQFYQKYAYDADNRLTTTESSKDGLIWDRDAAYTYYKHGPLAQMQVGDLNVQSVQYAYTIQGWLKAINGDILNPSVEMGKDGNGGGLYPKDVMAHSLDYFNGDYKQIGTQSVMHTAAPTKSLYNGNIVRQTTGIAAMDIVQRTYEYDQLNRLMQAQYATVHEKSFTVTNMPDYRNRYEYDADGNIQKLVRKASAGAALDSFIYGYAAGKNQLLRVDDKNVTTGGTDLKSGQPVGNYAYDAIGNLVKDRHAKYGEIGWNLYGKVKHIWDTTANGQQIYYEYDGTGQRVRKDVVRSGLPGWYADGYRTSDIYVRDATGNIMAVYKGSGRIDHGTTIEWLNDDIITEHGGWTTPSGTGLSPFIVWAYGADASFSTSLISRGITVSPTWTAARSSSHSLGFYLANGDGMYAAALSPFASYFTPMAADSAGLITTMLSANGFTASQPLMVPLLTDQNKRTGTLTHLNNATPALMTATLINCQVQNAPAMTPAQRLNSAQTIVAQQGPNFFYNGFVNAAQAQPTVTPVFYNAMVKDASLINAPWLSANPQVTSVMGGQMVAFAPRAATSWYMANFLTSSNPTWLTQNSTLPERLNVSYQYDRNEFLTAYLGGVGVAALNTTLRDLNGLTVGRYVYDLRRAIWFGGTLNPTYEPPTVSTPDPDNLKADTMYLAEHHLYGSSRLGIRNYEPSEYRIVYDGTKPAGEELVEQTLSNTRSWYSHGFADWIKPLKTSIYTGSVSNVFTDTLRERRFLGRKNYEFTDHLGNVLAVTLDRKTGYGASGGLYTGYSADLASVTDYYPFGMPMPGRNKEFSDYRFGQGTQMKSDEVYGDGSLYTAKFWEYDSRIARRWNLDPVDQISISNYAAFGNNPIANSDILGDKVKFMGYKNKEKAPMSDEQAEKVWGDIVSFMKEEKLSDEYDAIESSPDIFELYFFDHTGSNWFEPNQNAITGEVYDNINSAIYVNPWQSVKFKNYKQSGVEGILHEFGHAVLYNQSPETYFKEKSIFGTPFGSRHEERVITEFEFKHAGKLTQNPEGKFPTRGSHFEGRLSIAASWRLDWDKRDGSKPSNAVKPDDSTPAKKKGPQMGIRVSGGDDRGSKVVDSETFK